MTPRHWLVAGLLAAVLTGVVAVLASLLDPSRED